MTGQSGSGSRLAACRHSDRCSSTVDTGALVCPMSSADELAAAELGGETGGTEGLQPDAVGALLAGTFLGRVGALANVLESPLRDDVSSAGGLAIKGFGFDKNGKAFKDGGSDLALTGVSVEEEAATPVSDGPVGCSSGWRITPVAERERKETPAAEDSLVDL